MLMFSSLWKSCHASVCQLSFLNERGITVDSLTGFKVNNCLITSQHAFCVDKAFKVEIVFVDADANTITAAMRIPYAEFINEMRIGVVDSSGHYAVFNINLPDFQTIHRTGDDPSRITGSFARRIHAADTDTLEVLVSYDSHR